MRFWNYRCITHLNTEKFYFVEKIYPPPSYCIPRLLETHFSMLTEIKQYVRPKKLTMDLVNNTLRAKVMSSFRLKCSLQHFSENVPSNSCSCENCAHHYKMKFFTYFSVFRRPKNVLERKMMCLKNKAVFIFKISISNDLLLSIYFDIKKNFKRMYFYNYLMRPLWKKSLCLYNV